jgi:subtilisin family serine protease
MFRLRVISDKLNIRNTPVADPEFANWIGDSLKDELHFAEKRIKGTSYEGIDDWYVDEHKRFYWAGGVVEVPLPLTENDIIHFKSVANFPEQRLTWAQNIKGLPTQIIENKGDKIKIGLLDSGFEQKHVDLLGGVYAMRDFTGSSEGCNDVINHGSFMASLLCAKGFFDNQGIEGICSKASLILAKVVYERNDPGDFRSYAEGIAFAVQQGAQVINMSIGTGNMLDVPIVSQEIEKAIKQGVIFVASTKQVNFPVHELLQYPACHPQVIPVVSVTPSYYEKNKALFPKNLVITPRIKVPGAVNQSRMFYGQDTGSSVGTAIVSGLIALLLAAEKFDKRDKASVLEILKQYQSSPEELFADPTHFLIQA